MTHLLPMGFRFAGVACGLKSDPQKRDLTFIVSDRDAVAAGVYTQNIVQAASVVRNRALTPGNEFRAVVVNSGNANACTGEQGRTDVAQTAAWAAEACNGTPDQVLVMSTGVIGQYLPMEKIAAGIKAAAGELKNSKESLEAAAEAILTTDQFTKIHSRQLEVGRRTVRIAAIAKGAGMIGPNMATMLAVVLTDAPIAVQDAQRVLTEAADVSFNCISVEGHMSTSDTVLLLASGQAGGDPLKGSELADFQQAVSETCISLAKMIPDDGEGATHRIIIDVDGCSSTANARRIAQTIADSALVKTGIAGADPNWGRIVSAAGYAGVAFDPDRFQLEINHTLVYEKGSPVPFDAAALSRSMQSNRDVHLRLSFSEGSASVRFWTSDLTVDYVRFNSEYTT